MKVERGGGGRRGREEGEGGRRRKEKKGERGGGGGKKGEEEGRGEEGRERKKREGRGEEGGMCSNCLTQAVPWVYRPIGIFYIEHLCQAALLTNTLEIKATATYWKFAECCANMHAEPRGMHGI